MKKSDWYADVKDYTERLVRIRSVSPSADEIAVAQEILHLLHADGLESLYTESGLDVVSGDVYGRQNTYAFLQGQSSETLILLGHFDTVDTHDYGLLEPLALDPAALEDKKQLLLPAADHDTDVDDWMFGRGVADMKSGVAVNIALMRHYARASRQRPQTLSLLMIATPDEENESAGVLQALRFLVRLRDQYHLHYLGVLNTDYVTERYPGDDQRYIYAGSIGKLLPAFLCLGLEAHAGDPFQGLDANLLSAELMRDISMNDDLCDAVPGMLAAPPVTLRATDLKHHYDVQLPLAAYFYANVLTLTTTPAALLVRLRTIAEQSMKHVLQRVEAAECRWRERAGMTGPQSMVHARQGLVLTYAELYARIVQRLGGTVPVDHELQRVWRSLPADIDSRERSVHLTHHLWSLSGQPGPAIVIFYAPPYYPPVAPTPGPLQEAVDHVVAAHPECRLKRLPYFPYLSDMSYLNLAPEIELTALKDNLPVLRAEDGSAQLPGAYHLPFSLMQRLRVPVINWGPLGRGAHQRHESVCKSYTFGDLPQLLYETIEYFAS